VLSLAIADGKLFSGSYDYTIKVWSLDTLQRLKTLTGAPLPPSLLLHAAAHATLMLLAGYEGCVSPSSCWAWLRAGHSDAVRALAVANERLFSGSYDGTVKVWDVAALECLQTLAGHTGPVRTLVYSGGHMFSGSYDKTVRSHHACFLGARLSCLCPCLSWPAKLCRCEERDHALNPFWPTCPAQVRVWDVESLKCLSTLTGHSGAVRALAASSARVFSGSDDTTIKVWDSRSLDCLATLEGHEDNVRVLAVGERYVFSGSWDKSIRRAFLALLWRLVTPAGHLPRSDWDSDTAAWMQRM
jgi:F-box/WD-40 domain protein 7